ncbi:MAG: hypothetical protein M3R64_03965 [Pseudomonadota bacterium]|nr:hypothetical protein [Pseudomonadota bacterium]
MSPIEVAGWIGGALILAAYALVTTGKLSGKSATFQSMNVVGAAGLTLNGWAHGAVPVAALDAAWCAIGVAALVGIAMRRRSPR